MKLTNIYKQVVKETTIKTNDLSQMLILLEKEIKVGDTLTSKLGSIKNNNLATKMLSFLNSDSIKPNANVDYVDYDDKNEKLFTLGYKDREGNRREKLLKLNKLMNYLGADLSNVKAYDIEDIINHLKKGNVENLKVVKGDDILKAYHCENYDEGETMGSCMRYDYAQAYLEIYTDNPNQVQCLVLFNPDNNKVRGRALIWTLDDGTKFMDRVYTINKQYEVEFNNYAQQNNLETGTPSDDVTLDKDGEYDNYPYMDTFEYYDTDSGVLSQYDGGGYLHLQDTRGGNSSGMWSDTHNENIPEGEAVYVDHIDDWVYDHEVVMSFNEGEWLYRDSSDVVLITSGIHVDEWGLDDEVAELYDGNIVTMDDDFHMIDFGDREGELALNDDLIFTVGNEASLYDDVVQLSAGQHDGEYANPENAYIILTGDDEGMIIHYDDLSDYEDHKWVEYTKSK